MPTPTQITTQNATSDLRFQTKQQQNASNARDTNQTAQKQRKSTQAPAKTGRTTSQVVCHKITAQTHIKSQDVVHKRRY